MFSALACCGIAAPLRLIACAAYSDGNEDVIIFKVCLSCRIVRVVFIVSIVRVVRVGCIVRVGCTGFILCADDLLSDGNADAVCRRLDCIRVADIDVIRFDTDIRHEFFDIL